MTQPRYNYLPHPISEYGLFRSQPGDIVQMMLARKDQATWNFVFITDREIQKYHKVFMLRPSEADKEFAALLFVAYEFLNTIVDGVTIRHQVLHLPPDQFVKWFAAHGDFENLEYYKEIGDDVVMAFRNILPYSVAWTANYSEV